MSLEKNTEDIIIKSIKEITFMNMLKENYKEFYSKSGIIRAVFCLVLTLFFIYFVYALYSRGNYIEFLLNLINILIGGYLGLIAFALSAIAIVVSMLTNDFLKEIVQRSETNEEGLIKLRGLFFPYYFSAILDFVVLVLLIINLIFIYMESNWTLLILIIMSSITSFLSIYSIVYSIQLIGLSIRIRFIAAKF